MVKHIQAIRCQKPTNCLSVFDHFMTLRLKGLIVPENEQINPFHSTGLFQYAQKY